MVEFDRLVIGAVAYVFGYCAVYLVPGVLLIRALGIRLTNSVSTVLAAFVLSLAGMALAWIITMGVITGQGSRTSFYWSLAGLNALTLAALWPRNGDCQEGRRCGLSIGVAKHFVAPIGAVALMLLFGCLLMPGKVILESLDGDATEVHGFAASLFHGALPQWDIEVGVWGFYPTAMLFSYPVFFSLALGGVSEAAIRLPALLFLGVLVLAMVEMAGVGRPRTAQNSLRILLPILPVGYLSLQVGAYYAGYDPFHGDLGAAPLEQWIATALTMCGVVLVRSGAPGLGAIAAFMAVISYLSGPALVAIFGAVGLLVTPPGEREALMKSAVILSVLIIGYVAFFVIYSVVQGTLEPIVTEWLSKYFSGRFALENPMRIVHTLGWYTLLSGGLPIVGYVLAFRSSDHIAKWLALSGIMWTAIFVLSPLKNIHYFMPVAMIPVVLAVRQTGTGRYGRVLMNLLLLSGVMSIVLSWPKSVPPYTADREFGRKTVFLASSGRDAVEDAMVIYNLVKPLSVWKAGDSWTIGHHTWVHYSDRTPQPVKQYEFYVGREGTPVAGIQKLGSVDSANGQQVSIWSRNNAFAEWRRRTFPLKRDLSYFNFDLQPSRWK